MTRWLGLLETAPFALVDVQQHWHRLEDYAGHDLLLVFHRHLS